MRRLFTAAGVGLACVSIAAAAASVLGTWLPWVLAESFDLTLVGILVCGTTIAVAIGIASTIGRTPRAVYGAFALVSVGGLAWDGYDALRATLRRVPIVTVVVLLLGLASAITLAILAPRLRGARIAIPASLVAGIVALALSFPALRDGWIEYQDQRLAPFTLELVAAYPYQVGAASDLPPIDPSGIQLVLPALMPAVVVDAQGRVGDIVTLDGRRFNLHRGDAVRFDSHEVARVRWLDDGTSAFITLRLSHQAMLRWVVREHDRMSQYDAVLVDDRPQVALLHFGAQRILLSSDDRRALWTLYRRLTG